MGLRASGGAGRVIVSAALSATIGIGATVPWASAAVPHVVQPGESLWSVAAANGLTTAGLASYNGLAEDSWLFEGETIQIPSPDEAGVTATTATASAPAYGLLTISGPLGSVQLDPSAGTAWESMRASSLAQFGIDLYPAGTLSGYRTYDQQAYLYDLFISGQGAPANPPGTSTHEIGIAMDIPDPSMRNVIDQIGPTYGWYGISSEWWHVEYWG